MTPLGLHSPRSISGGSPRILGSVPQPLARPSPVLRERRRPVSNSRRCRRISTSARCERDPSPSGMHSIRCMRPIEPQPRWHHGHDGASMRYDWCPLDRPARITDGANSACPSGQTYCSITGVCNPSDCEFCCSPPSDGVSYPCNDDSSCTQGRYCEAGLAARHPRALAP
jgi:hypothetical protein